MDVPGKGMGVFTTAYFSKGAFLCEYTGELIKAKAGHEREKLYGCKSGSFLIYFWHNGEQLW